MSTWELGLMPCFHTFGQRCCVVTVDQLSFFLVLLYFRGWGATILDFPASRALRGGHVLAKKR